ncbi:response regulator transcription factor [Bradyrhizobium xenonodulans]|uniref:Response regulator transcription factor n=1 Tax=Bradyrhizobium xenonodulans TaxID=2736875 RepID=A0ABY7MUZ3_9BRAD|nr:response regulator transcription factor [Bradyrhizobium xenonodulans]WBL81354.1 response regulator transcription factor [Bradyrhizobium xenonodulans]
MRILLIEDMNVLAAMMEEALTSDGFVVDVVEALEDAAAAIECAPYDIVLLDRKLPDGDGLSWLRARRRCGFACPTIITTAVAGVHDRIEGLNAGADDYLVKPFSVDELIARIRAVLRRPPSLQNPSLRAGNLEFDTVSRQVWINGCEVRIPRRDLCLLEVLVRRFERVVTRGSLEESLYSFNDEVSSNAIEVGVYRLRAHLSEAAANVRVRTVRGVGYVLEAVSRDKRVDAKAGDGVARSSPSERREASRRLLGTGAS